jgi:DNA-binding HxlR family transcriptional regulator
MRTMSIDTGSLDGAVSRIGDRWSLRIIAALLEGERTFSELTAQVEGIAPNVLAARLRALTGDAVVTAVPYQQRPVRMRYALTAQGARLAGAVSALAEWGADREGRRGGMTHAPCGSVVQTRPWCPTCDRVVAGDEVTSDVWC